MRFANVNSLRLAAAPGLSGSCPVCERPMIAKCGTQRVHHWAHLGKRVCDHWWEPETEWHRAWKQEFPPPWQEAILRDPTGEKHIADVKVPDGITIEFQHSHIRAEERMAREHFYGDMVWVVNGLRLRRDLPRFLQGARTLRPLARGVFVHPHPAELFPRSWLKATAPVVFDFGSVRLQSGQRGTMEHRLWCLLPQIGERATVLTISRDAFISTACEKSAMLLFHPLRIKLDQALAIERKKLERKRLQHYAAMLRRRREWCRGRRRL